MAFAASSTNIRLADPIDEAVTLYATCFDALGNPRESSISLNDTFGIFEGKFKPNRSGFARFAKAGSIRIVVEEYTSVYLHADLKLKGEMEYNHSSIDLNKYFTNTGGKLVPVRTRTLILFFDGTTNKFGTDNTNVVKLMGCLDRSDPSSQLFYYQAGIGTYVPPGYVAGTWFIKRMDEGAGIFLQDHILGGYNFLSQTYREDDKICIFGFSRGAYTARALAAMLHKVGLLYPNNHEQAPFAYDMFKRVDKEGKELAGQFKRHFCQPVEADFVGVWDTVGSIGVVIPRTLPFVDTNDSIRIFRHAVSLDEHRVKFLPSLWGYKEQKKDRHGKLMTTDAKEVWFAGEHCDVGGGATPNTEPHALSYISLRWMIKECIESKIGILFSYDALKSLGMPVLMADNVLGLSPRPQGEDQAVTEKERRATELLWEKDREDVRYGSIQYAFAGLAFFFWAFVECLPFMRHWRDRDGSHIPIIPNFGGPRKLSYSSKKVIPRVHISVKERMEHTKNLGLLRRYEPRARWEGYPAEDPKHVLWEL